LRHQQGFALCGCRHSNAFSKLRCFRLAGGSCCPRGGLVASSFHVTRSNITAVDQQGGRIVREISTRECQRTSLKRWLAVLAAAAAGLWVTTAAVANDNDNDVLPQCRALQVPVSLAQVPGASLYGELCVPATGTPSVVQLLVHGASYNRYYSD